MNVFYRHIFNYTTLVLIVGDKSQQIMIFFKIKSPWYSRSRDITPKRVTSGGAHLRDLAPAQHSFEET